MQEYEMSPIEKINEDELQNITGGCGACEPDKKIRNESFALVNAWQEKRAPAGTTGNDINNAIAAGTAAMKRIDQRHPNLAPKRQWSPSLSTIPEE